MSVEFALDQFLERHGLSAYRVSVEAEGKIARASVFSMARSKNVKRVDLESLGHLLDILEALTGRKVQLSDLFQVSSGEGHQLRRTRSGLPFSANRDTNRLLESSSDVLDDIEEAKRICKTQ